MTTNVKPIPDGMHTLTPYLTVKDAPAAIDFYVKAFDAIELMRIPGPDGRLLHASLRIGDSVLMMTEEFPEFSAKGPKALGGSPVSIHMYVENVDAAWDKAVAAGCQITMPLDDAFWGDRFGALVDPFGHNWSLAQQIREMTAEEMTAAAAELDMMGCAGAE